LTRRANQRHYSIIAQFFKIAHGAAHRALGATTGQKSPQLALHRLATANDRWRVAVPRALAIRVPEEKST
jgi:hypothetical protein